MSDDNNIEKARNLRKNMTDAEQTLWFHLRKSQLKNKKFRRQEPIGDYIVDFICYELGLVIEVDGSQHLEQKQYDNERTQWLEGEEFTVIRFWNHDVLNSTEQVLDRIIVEINKLE